MDRRHFLGTCTASAACLPLAASFPAWASAEPVSYAPVLLTDANRQPLKASALRPHVNYIFHYPFEATPVFLLNLGRRVSPRRVGLGHAQAATYDWPGGVGDRGSIVAYSAICSHKLVYPNRDVSFISFRRDRALQGVQNEMIHCCAEHSQYDPAAGASVMSGPAPQPLAAVLLRHDPKQDTLTAYATLGPELFNQFFEKYATKLAFESGPKAQQPVARESPVYELERFCRNNVKC